MSAADLDPGPAPTDDRKQEKIPALTFEQRAHPPPILTLADVAAFLCLPSRDSASRLLKNLGVPRVVGAGRTYVLTETLLARLRELEEVAVTDAEIRRRADEDLKTIAPTARAKRRGTKPLTRKRRSA